ncbi:MAG: ATP-binding protein [Cocleimonas sp.]|nr:ATP-binding protein [Cocleimonas sp.]
MANNYFPETSEQYRPIIERWILRTLIDLRGYTLMSMGYGLEEYDKVLTFIGLEHLIEKYEDDRLKKKKLRKLLKPLHKKNAALINIKQGPLFNNMDKLADLIGMNTAEKELLSFCMILNTVREIENVTEILGSLSSANIINALAVILDINTTKVRKALSSDGLLYRTGLARLSRDTGQLFYQLATIGDMGEVLLDDSQPDMMKSLTRFFAPGKKSTLQPDDFKHLQNDYQLLHRYLEISSKESRKGVNVLIYGVPGTGKTEMVRTLATSLKMQLYEVSADVVSSNYYDDEDHSSRMDSYRLCLQVLKRKKNTLILFDEIEDAFIRDGSMERFGIRTSTNAKKGSLNHILESNQLPTLWVSNVISHIDEAIIRRFDYIVELKIPPKSTRFHIIKKHVGDLSVSEAWIDKISNNESLAPALISRAVNVVKALGEKQQIQIEASMERILSNTLNAMGYDKNLSNPHPSVLTYRLEGVNPDYDLAGLQTGLKKSLKGTFCFYGPSGTGKSEFVHQLANVLEKPLLIKRASDLLDPYIGMTERNICNMFEQAKYDQSILLLDEADSFLRDRTLSRESWEVTQVNELLTQMEQFEGLFFCTTNLMEVLDQASLRRFDLKVKFDYLKAAQAWVLFQQTLADAGSDPIKDEKTFKNKVRALQGITPGDFATALRQNRFSTKEMTAEYLLEALMREIKFKQYGAFKEIGFMTHQVKQED